MPADQNYPPYFPNFFVFIFFPRVFIMFFFVYLVSSTLKAWQIFKSSYYETIKKILVSSNELLNICQSSTLDFTLLCKKHTSMFYKFLTLFVVMK